MGGLFFCFRRSRLSISSSAPPVASSASLCDAPGWEIGWRDEFDTFDASTWVKDVRGPGDSRTRDAAARAENVWVADGALVIEADAAWTGSAWTNLTAGAVRSTVGFRGPARVCVVARLPGGGNGVWPAHWLMPLDDSCWPCHGELDIMEMIDADGVLHGTYHWCANATCGDGPAHLSDTFQTPVALDGWHEFAVEFGPGAARFAVDGAFYGSVAPDALLWNTSYYAILNTAIGGPWPRPPDAATTFPNYHRIDAIRVAYPKAV